jgi:hypothetical protein
MFTLPPDLLSSPYQAFISHMVPSGARMARLERATNSHALAVAWSKISPESGFFSSSIVAMVRGHETST